LQQNDCMLIELSLTPIFSSIYMKHFEKLTLDPAQHKPSLWLRYVDDKFVVWSHGPERIRNFLNYLNCSRPSVQFTLEIESGSVIPLLHVLVIRKETTLATKVYRKPTHFGRYLNFKCNYSPACELVFNSESSKKNFRRVPRTPRSV
jgi:hypothetical protein